MNRWRTIDSAPRDGTEIIVGGDGDIEFVRWVEGAGWADRVSEDFPNATHWMELPAPPDAQGGMKP